MKIVIFAGGVGTRLWPLSRKSTPKQFEKIIDTKSTLQLTVERVLPIVKPEDIYISSGERYKEVLFAQLPQIPKENFIFEPEMRDVGAAVGLITAILAKITKEEPFFIIWSDHLVKNDDLFRGVLRVGEKILQQDKNKIVFVGQSSRFASQNLGWIEVGDTAKTVDGVSLHAFKSFHYRPKPKIAEEFHVDPKHFWNTGYFGTTASFLLSMYKKFAPEMYVILQKIQETFGTELYEKTLRELFPKLEKNSFDNLILEKIEKKDGYVIGADFGWSDVGAWEALKEALSSVKDENVTRGKVLLEDSKDNLVFNYTDQLSVGIDLSEMLVINTDDVLLICPKNSVPKIKKLVESLTGSPHEHLT